MRRFLAEEGSGARRFAREGRPEVRRPVVGGVVGMVLLIAGLEPETLRLVLGLGSGARPLGVEGRGGTESLVPGWRLGTRPLGTGEFERRSPGAEGVYVV